MLNIDFLFVNWKFIIIFADVNRYQNRIMKEVKNCASYA